MDASTIADRMSMACVWCGRILRCVVCACGCISLARCALQWVEWMFLLMQLVAVVNCALVKWVQDVKRWCA